MKFNNYSLTMLSEIIFMLFFLNVFYCYEELVNLNLFMPDVQPTVEESYFCTAFRMRSDRHQYIVEFKPNATKNTAHHILLFGCEVPGYYERDSPRAIWDCNHMSDSKSDLPRAETCKKSPTIIYAWAMDAKKLVLPPDVGFKVGGDTGINFLVLQVHYANVDKFKNGLTDSSGITISLADGFSNTITKRAAVFLAYSLGIIPRNSEEHMEIACKMTEPIEIHPFAFRTHTHKLGTLVSGWKINNGNWELIGKHNPQEPQMFYPVEKNVSIIRQGDIVAARCTMVNNQDHDVHIGSTANDEMCNFYIMYYVEGDEILNKNECYSAGPPFYYWRNDEKFQNSIDWITKEASNP